MTDHAEGLRVSSGKKKNSKIFHRLAKILVRVLLIFPKIAKLGPQKWSFRYKRLTEQSCLIRPISDHAGGRDVLCAFLRSVFALFCAANPKFRAFFAVLRAFAQRENFAFCTVLRVFQN